MSFQNSDKFRNATYTMCMTLLNEQNSSSKRFEVTRLTSFGVTLRVHSASRTTSIRVLDIAASAFELLANLMEQPLPLNKMDFILVPDYDGGMENWGHVLISRELATSGDDAHLTYVIAHELAHHWIGNLATVDSWQYVCLQEDLTDYIAYKIVRALLSDDERYARFRLSKYVEIQLAEDFISPGHSLLMPEALTKEMISSHCYLKGVTYLESLESVVGEEYMFTVIRNLVSRYPSFNLTTFTTYFEEINIEYNITLGQVYQYWFTTGGLPAVYVQNNGSTSQITQYSSVLWPLRIAATNPNITPLPDFMFTQTLLHSTEPIILNLNFTSFLRVNYDLDTWSSIFNFMSRDPTIFSTVGRAQLVSDFCYFYSQAQIPGSSELRDTVIDIVYSHPESFDLCDWNLYWCYSSNDVSLFSTIIRQLMNGLTNLFEYDSAFGCRKGHAVKRVNSFCDSIFGKKCI
ncbi:unnamed protein product [Auanema sp. JU1783]|nr:unnamed protein product [Auanema sp. JU1783]